MRKLMFWILIGIILTVSWGEMETTYGEVLDPYAGIAKPNPPNPDEWRSQSAVQIAPDCKIVLSPWDDTVVALTNDPSGRTIEIHTWVNGKPVTNYIKCTSDIEIDAWMGKDTINLEEYSWGRAIVYGGSGKDTIIGTPKGDMLYGEEHKDTINGIGGDDLISGGSGVDTLTGGIGNDNIMGGEEGDIIYGDFAELNALDGNDIIWGGDGNDRILGCGGDDILLGQGDGDYDYWWSTGPSTNLFGGPGNDIIWGGDGSDYMSGWSEDDNILGEEGDDWAYGGEGDDYIYGGKGSDTLKGEADDDTIFGGSQDDTLYGDSTGAWGIPVTYGLDFICGGSGNDYLDHNGRVQEKVHANTIGGDGPLLTDDAGIQIGIDTGILGEKGAMELHNPLEDDIAQCGEEAKRNGKCTRDWFTGGSGNPNPEHICLDKPLTYKLPIIENPYTMNRPSRTEKVPERTAILPDKPVIIQFNFQDLYASASPTPTPTKTATPSPSGSP